MAAAGVDSARPVMRAGRGGRRPPSSGVKTRAEAARGWGWVAGGLAARRRAGAEAEAGVPEARGGCRWRRAETRHRVERRHGADMRRCVEMRGRCAAPG